MPLQASPDSLAPAPQLSKNGEYERSIRILARTLVRTLTAEGYEVHHLIQLSSELIHQLTVSVKDHRHEEAVTPTARAPVYPESA